jgi:hypothetical protein
MHSLLITTTMIVAVALIHFSWVDFRFRYREGILWFWLLNPAPPIMWAARATIVAAMIIAIASAFVPTTANFVYVLSGVMALHIICLILLEVLEPR